MVRSVKLLVELKEMKDRKFKKTNGEKIEGTSLRFIISKEIEGVKFNGTFTFSKDALGKYAGDLTTELGNELELTIEPTTDKLSQYFSEVSDAEPEISDIESE